MRLSTLAKYAAQHREAFDLKVGSFNSTHDHVFGRVAGGEVEDPPLELLVAVPRLHFLAINKKEPYP
jgi:hypothetical protein